MRNSSPVLARLAVLYGKVGQRDTALDIWDHGLQSPLAVELARRFSAVPPNDEQARRLKE